MVLGWHRLFIEAGQKSITPFAVQYKGRRALTRHLAAPRFFRIEMVLPGVAADKLSFARQLETLAIGFIGFHGS